jgi:hypothetical protein
MIGVLLPVIDLRAVSTIFCCQLASSALAFQCLQSDPRFVLSSIFFAGCCHDFILVGKGGLYLKSWSKFWGPLYPVNA